MSLSKSSPKTKTGSSSDRPAQSSEAFATADEVEAGRRLLPQMWMLLRTLWASPERIKIALLGVALVAVIGATAFGQVKLNAWNQPFYDALSHKDLHGFIAQLSVFGLLAGVLLVLNVAQGWLNMTTKVSLREGL